LTHFCKFKGRRHYQEYEKTMKIVKADINYTLDLVNIVRRLRLHGFALSVLLPPAAVNTISKQCDKSTLEDPA